MSEHEHEHGNDRLPNELATLLVERVQRAVKIALDFTPDTLPILDHYLQLNAEKELAFKSEVAKSDQGVVVGLVPETLAIELAAYLGEVAVRSLPGGARWRWNEHHPGETRIEFGHISLCFSPVGMAFEALELPTPAGMDGAMVLRPEDYESLQPSLDALGQVDERDFNRLTLRFEVLSHVADTLLTKEAMLREKAASMKGDADDGEHDAPIIELYDSTYYAKLLSQRQGPSS